MRAHEDVDLHGGQADRGRRHQRRRSAQPGIARRPVQARNRQPAASSGGTCIRNWASAPEQRTRPPSPATICAAGEAHPPQQRGPRDRDDVEHRRRERGHAETLARALSMPMATAANETSGRKGSITRVSRTVSSTLPGTAVEARRDRSGRAARRSTTPSTMSAASTTASTVSTPWRAGSARGPALVHAGRAHRSARTRPRARPPRRGRAAGSGCGRRRSEGVGVEAGAQQRGEHLLADEPEEPRDEGERGDRAPPAHQRAPGRPAARRPPGVVLDRAAHLA